MKTTLPSLKARKTGGGDTGKFPRTFEFHSDSFDSYDKASAAVRGITQIARLSHEQAEEVRGMVARHAARKANRPMAAPMAGRILRLQEGKLRTLAVRVGHAYHTRIASLATSARADVVFGNGGQVEWDNNAYSKSYGYGAKFQNAGARWDDARLPDGRRILILESSRGTEKARIPIDTRRPDAVITEHPGLVNGDLFGTIRHGILLRFGWQKKKIVPTGVAVQFPTVGGRGQYWEHGVNIDACRRENAHKIERETARSIGERESAKVSRYARLLLRFAPNLPVTYGDARSAGACDAGIKGWANRLGLSVEGTTTLATIKATEANWAQKIARVKAASLLAAKVS